MTHASHAARIDHDVRGKRFSTAAHAALLRRLDELDRQGGPTPESRAARAALLAVPPA